MAKLRQDQFNLTRLFYVTIDHLEAAVFHEAEGLNAQLDVVEYQEGGENTFRHKLVGPTRWSNIVLRRGTSDSLEFYEWVKECIQGKVQRKSGTIIALGRDHTTTVAEWQFKNAWPCRYQGPDFSTIRSPDMAIEEIELAHDGFEMIKG